MANLAGGSGYAVAGSGAGSGEIEFALKRFYLPGMEEQKNNARVLLAELERNEKDVSGDSAFIPILLKRNWGIGMRANRETLPTAGAQEGTRAQIPMRYAFGRLIVTLHAMAATKNMQGSYDTVLDVETEGLMEDLPKDINRQFFGDGSGKLATVVSSATPTLTVDNTQVSAPKNSAEFTKYIESGQKIDVYTTTVKDLDAIEVLSVTANTITMTAAFTDAADNDDIYMAGNKDQEITGLLAMINTSNTYQDINRATGGNERWQGNVITTTGDLQETDMQTVWTSCQKASGMDPTIILGTYEARDRYAKILQADRRFMNTIEYKGGFSGPEFHGVGLVPDTECPRGELFFLNLPYIALYQQAGLQFMDDDGAILSRSAGYAAYEATLYWFFEMGARRCNVHGRLTGQNQ